MITTINLVTIHHLIVTVFYLGVKTLRFIVLGVSNMRYSTSVTHGQIFRNADHGAEAIF